MFSRMTKNRGKSGVTAAKRLERTIIREKTNIPAIKLEIVKSEVKKVLKQHIGIDENEISVIIRMSASGGRTGATPVLEITVPVTERKQTAES